MSKPQWLAAGIAFVLVIGLYIVTSSQIFGDHAPLGAAQPTPAASGHAGEWTIDSVLTRARKNLTQQQQNRLNRLQIALQAAQGPDKLHQHHQLARYWADSLRLFEPYAWHTAEAARLENSEKSLTFAAHLFLANLKGEDVPELRHWKAHQAKDLFERSLKVNPANDSSAVGLGAVYLFGNLSDNPMEGIQRIRAVAEKDSGNLYAQMTLGHASVVSGQLDRAIERFSRVVRIEPANLEGVLSLAEAYERKGDKAAAISWYQKSLSLADIPGLREEVEKRINSLRQ